ncbi:helix-turn-helix transcriptional regulator [Desulfosediminicola ganghwensis]|uniref:helix-turn-helix transcriptional regulator n=1 Tax=Desulfosediminicola ganghwensis TaxID=2569540 RepID=UPI0010AD39C4|nr:LuxR family transcriptional regulator [Desulfosediminicola ganghwensis]
MVSDITQQKKLETRIVEQKQHAEEMNLTLRNVLKSIEKEKKEFEENLSLRIRNSLLPTLSRIRNERDDEWRSGYLSMLEEQMISLTEDFSQALDGDLLRLSKTELRICRFVKAGLTGKEICDTLNLSFETIQTHRKNIRKKLGLRGKEINLHTFLADRGL